MDVNVSLPEEIVFEILLKLPAKSLKRFRCVCKSWSSHIDSFDFVKMHYHTNKISRTNLNAIYLRDSPSPATTTSGICFSLLSDETNMGTTEAPLPYMFGESGGLVLFANHWLTVAAGLLNPATNEFKSILKSTMEGPDGISLKLCSIWSWGFGYDSVSDDYEVVYIEDCIDRTLQIKMYTLSSNCWKEICFYEFRHAPFHKDMGTYVNGRHHWLFHFGQRIFALDMAGESFQIMDFPFDVSSNYEQHLKLYNGYLALFATLCNDYDSTIMEIWVMKDYGVKESWTKQTVIELISPVSELIGMWKSNDEWLSRTWNGQYVLYNPQNKVVKNLQIRGCRRLPADLVIFTENLYSFNGTFLSKIKVEENFRRVWVGGEKLCSNFK